MTYNRLNILVGWLIFIASTYVFVSTIEPTASFWDCGEFIASSVKLEVGHPPGAPFFMLIGRFFSLFGDMESQAMWINVMSALSSSLTILFLFWTITHLAKRILSHNQEPTSGATWAILGAGIVGAMAYTFSDSFWFSAVEGEVYAMSSLFTAVVFWAMLKWENVSHKVDGDRWIVLIAYLMGLSIGVHLLNLLAIPAIGIIYYFRNYEFSWKGLAYAAAASVGALGFMQAGIIPGTVELASFVELFTVNDLGMGFNTGLYVFVALLATLVITLIIQSRNPSKSKAGIITAALVLLFIPVIMAPGDLVGPLKKFVIFVFFGGIGFVSFYLQQPSRLMNVIVTSVTAILIGYSSFTVILIRSAANPPMDENNPEHAFALLSYLNREQYGDRPLMSGQYFNAPYDQSNFKDGKPTYAPDYDKGEYVITDDKKNSIPAFDSDFTSILPRMWSNQASHVKEYMKWAGIKESELYNPMVDKDGNIQMDEYNQIKYDRSNPKRKPSMSENIQFFWDYQIGWMYKRYFMWNFAGRQNDVQGHGVFTDGNWLTGFNWFDENVLGLGPQENLPEYLANNPARNTFFMLPLILGILGMLYQFIRDWKGGVIVALLFFFTGLAIVIYLNQYPLQPRERDYAYAASFYAYGIWIGLGVLLIYEALRSFMSGAPSAIVSTALCFMGVPYIMGKEGWDDHDRSNTYTARDFALNYLNSCDENAVLFTNGDNDTFPLWYVQEVEEKRTDVRVVNLSLLNTDWYIDQQRRAAYEAAPVPFGMDKEKYVQGTRDAIYLIESAAGALGPYAFMNEKYDRNKKKYQRRFEKVKSGVFEVFENSNFKQVNPKAWESIIERKNNLTFVDMVQMVDYLKSQFKTDKYEYNKESWQEYLSQANNLKKDIQSIKALDVRDALAFATNDENALPNNSRKAFYFPTKNFSVAVDSAKVIENGTLKEKYKDKMVDQVQWRIGKSMITKNDMMIMDLLANNDWERPIYFAITTGNAAYIGLQRHFQCEGLTYRLVPMKTKGLNGQTGKVDTEIMYQNLMNEFRWGGMDSTVERTYVIQSGDSLATIAAAVGSTPNDLRFQNPDIDFSPEALTEGKQLTVQAPLWIYLNENNQRMCMNLRNNFSRLAEALIAEGEKEKAEEVLDRCMQVMPESMVPYNYFVPMVADAYYKVGAKEKARWILNRLFDMYSKEMDYYVSLDKDLLNTIKETRLRMTIYSLNTIQNSAQRNGEKDLTAKVLAKMQAYDAEMKTKGIFLYR